ncbi:hypothetical protein JHN52_30660 [Streptomyces sp. MBT97]|uniref:hypothetical protein n=1 Tax=Streptomyces sp. MBT97 TaxID=2800411 RepID=UPI00190E2020|nr:hypothetical protein [Streptomyces sp. MBT97]MBK3637189.1 hypothetical protein [Streptomyces sp. MBT97]
MDTAAPLVTATVTERHRTERIRLDVTGAPPIEVRELGAREDFHPTGLLLAYEGTKTTEIRVPTAEGEELFIRLDEIPGDPVEPWILEFAEDHRPHPREHDRARAWEAVAAIVERARSKGVTEIDTDLLADALGLDEEEPEGPDVDGAGRTRAEYDVTTADPCQPYQRYGCGHCRHQDCPNPGCGHCPCKCECR